MRCSAGARATTTPQPDLLMQGRAWPSWESQEGRGVVGQLLAVVTATAAASQPNLLMQEGRGLPGNSRKVGEWWVRWYSRLLLLWGVLLVSGFLGRFTHLEISG